MSCDSGVRSASRWNTYTVSNVVWRVSLEETDNAFLGAILFSDIVHACAFSPSQNWLAVGGESGVIALLSVKQEFRKILELPCLAGVHCIAWSPDSRFIASGGEDNRISIWCLSRRELVCTLPKCDDWFKSVAFAPDMSCFAACQFGSKDVTFHPIEVTEIRNIELEEDVDSEYDEEFEPDVEDGDEQRVVSVPPVPVSVTEQPVFSGIQVLRYASNNQ